GVSPGHGPEATVIPDSRSNQSHGPPTDRRAQDWHTADVHRRSGCTAARATKVPRWRLRGKALAHVRGSRASPCVPAAITSPGSRSSLLDRFEERHLDAARVTRLEIAMPVAR